MDEEAVADVARLARSLRARFHVEHGYTKRQPGKGLRDADRAGARYAGLIGARERADGVVQLKHLASGTQASVALADLAAALDRPEPAVPADAVAPTATQEV
jgi:histidyl-tRNA synthetase